MGSRRPVYKNVEREDHWYDVAHSLKTVKCHRCGKESLKKWLRTFCTNCGAAWKKEK